MSLKFIAYSAFGLLSAAMGDGNTAYSTNKKHKSYPKTELNKKQQKSRKASKAAKKARRKNR